MSLATESTSNQPDSVRQQGLSRFFEGSWIVDDTGNHDFALSGGGRSALTIGLQSTASSTFAVSVYGMLAASGAVGGVGSILINSTAISGSGIVQTAALFPAYLVRSQATDTGDRSGAECRIYLNLKGN